MAAVFNILANRIDIAGSRWLDLFAGTGALGLDALSRGAAGVTFIDDSRESCRFVRDNLTRSGFADRAEVRRLSLPRGCAAWSARTSASVARSSTRRIGAARSQRNAGRPLAIAACWSRRLGRSPSMVPKNRSPNVTGRLTSTDSRRYGSTGVSLYAMEEP